MPKHTIRRVPGGKAIRIRIPRAAMQEIADWLAEEHEPGSDLNELGEDIRRLLDTDQIVVISQMSEGR